MRTPRKTKQELKEEEDTVKLQEFLKKYHLNSIDEKDLESLKEIALDLLGMGIIKGIAFAAMPVFESAKLRYSSALVRQNFIIIRKLDEMIKKLDK